MTALQMSATIQPPCPCVEGSGPVNQHEEQEPVSLLGLGRQPLRGQAAAPLNHSPCCQEPSSLPPEQDVLQWHRGWGRGGEVVRKDQG